MKRNRLAIVFGSAAVLLFGLVAAACGDTITRVDDSGGNQPSGITVSGEGKATGKPDIARITLGVSKEAASVEEARSGAAASLDAMIKSMRDNGVAKDDIQTEQFSIQPEYDYRDNKQTLRGFRVTNVVSAKLRDINKTSKVVDDAATAGGNDAQVQNIAFTIDKPDELKKQARESAVADAKARAETLAATTGVSVGDPVYITETGGGVPVPLYYGGAESRSAADTAPATPIEPGTLDVTISVTVTWSIK
jgi:hypothetical protein